MYNFSQNTDLKSTCICFCISSNVPIYYNSFSWPSFVELIQMTINKSFNTLTVRCITFSAPPLTGWNVTLENKTSNSLQLRWMDINHRLNSGVRFFVVISKSSYSSVPVRKIFSPNITSAEITELDPYTVYNVSVVAIDGYGSPFQSTFLLARTSEGGK